MKKKIITVVLILTTNCFATNPYQKEKFVWSHSISWATFDQDLNVYYRFVPFTEQASDVISKLDRRYNYECNVKERNLRNFLGAGSVIIALYRIKDCTKISLNKNW